MLDPVDRVEQVRRQDSMFERLLGESTVQRRHSMFDKYIACNLTS